MRSKRRKMLSPDFMALERARGTDVVAVDLEIDAGHSRAESLYRRFDFRPLERSRWVKELTT
jgi:hypothetical protein